MSSKNDVFAEGFSFYKYFWIFIFFSFIGSIYEEGLFALNHFIKYGSFIFEYRRGVIFGPFNVVYGFGACLLMFLFIKHEYSYLKTFIYGSLMGGVIEYVISLLQDIFIGTTSWNYSKQFLNINGRTTIPIMIFWGICTVLFVKIIYPKLSFLIEHVPVYLGNKTTFILVILMSINIIFSWSALIRQTLRRNNIDSFGPVGEFYDKYYNDEKLEKYFPNMKKSKRR